MLYGISIYRLLNNNLIMMCPLCHLTTGGATSAFNCVVKQNPPK